MLRRASSESCLPFTVYGLRDDSNFCFSDFVKIVVFAMTGCKVSVRDLDVRRRFLTISLFIGKNIRLTS